MAGGEIHRLGAARLAALVAAREISPDDTADGLLRRIDRVDRGIDAFRTADAE